ncbi:type VII secretion protein EccB [Streptomyces sp. CA-135486]|uniref:type VII secretion protein EccB n=1 Tax=Streptomyces sp. CA-135486 TaxID=3240049 RepID=UPI003D90D9DC
MQNKRDQVQAHMFLMGRLTSGMLRADPDAPESPQGRTNRGIALGVIFAVLVSAGAFVFGLLSPGTKGSWRSSGDLIVEKQTGSRYLYLDGRLRPVRNYASARLLGGADLKAATVGSASLNGTPHGAPVGILGAPDSLPGAGQLSPDPWQVCSIPTVDGKTAGTLAVGRKTVGTPLDKHQGVLVSGPDGADYLLWGGSRLRLDRRAGAPEALGYGSVTPVKVSGALLSALPSGPDLTPPTTTGLGEPAAELGGRATRVGQVFTVSVPGSGSQLYLLRRDGLAPLTSTLAALVLGDARTRQLAYEGASPTITTIGSHALRGRLAPRTAESDGPGRLPDAPPKAVGVPVEHGPCVQITPDSRGDKGPRTSISLATQPSLGPAVQTAVEGVSAACLPVDRVTVPPGGGALIHALGAGGGKLGSTVYLVTDTGVKYRIATADAVKALGYEKAEVLGLPSLLLAMLPSGPDLSPRAAEQGRSSATAPRCDWDDKIATR